MYPQSWSDYHRPVFLAVKGRREFVFDLATRQVCGIPPLLAAAGYHVGHFRKAWGPGKAERQPAGQTYESVDAFFADRKGKQPFCFWFGTSDPHRPYVPGSGKRAGIPLERLYMFPWFPDDDVVRNDVADYCFEAQRFDREVGQLWDRLQQQGELDNTIFVVTGDHGMPFPRCKGNVYDGGTRVPLAICGPKIPAHRTVTDFVSLTDIAPTFLEAAGVPVPAEMTGISLLPILQSDKSGQVDPTRDYVVFGAATHDCPGTTRPRRLSCASNPHRSVSVRSEFQTRSLAGRNAELQTGGLPKSLAGRLRQRTHQKRNVETSGHRTKQIEVRALLRQVPGGGIVRFEAATPTKFTTSPQIPSTKKPVAN